jgi:hypothetical protein
VLTIAAENAEGVRERKKAMLLFSSSDPFYIFSGRTYLVDEACAYTGEKRFYTFSALSTPPLEPPGTAETSDHF